MQNSSFYYKIDASEYRFQSPHGQPKRELRHILMPVKKLDNLLKSAENPRLGKLIQRAQNMDSLTTAIKSGLEEDLADNLMAANLHDDGLLVLICSTPAWASRLRFEADALLAIARATGAKVHTCHVKVSR
jgi:hypothetical protein